MRSDSVKNMSAYADQNHAPSLTDVRLELDRSYNKLANFEVQTDVTGKSTIIIRNIDNLVLK